MPSGATREVLARSHQAPPGKFCQDASRVPMFCSTAATYEAQQGWEVGQSWGGVINICLYPPYSSGCRPWQPPSQCPAEPSCLSSSLVRVCTLCRHGGRSQLLASPHWDASEYPQLPPSLEGSGQRGGCKAGSASGRRPHAQSQPSSMHRGSFWAPGWREHGSLVP